MNFAGLGTALVTPMRGGKVDEDALAQLVDRQIQAQVDYLVVLGTTGEASTLSTMEKRKVVDICIQANSGRVPLVLGTFGGNHTAEQIRRMKDEDLTGISALLSASPHYNRPSQSGIVDHYLALDDATPLPIIIYNVPSRTGSNLTAETTLEIARQTRHIIGVKEASGDMMQGAKLIKHRPEGFLVLSGDDPTALPLMSLGGDGIISVISNAYPSVFKRMVIAMKGQDLATAQDCHRRLLDLHYYLYVEGNPVGVKASLAEMGFCTDEVRLPLKSLSSQHRAALNKEMQQLEAAISSA